MNVELQALLDSFDEGIQHIVLEARRMLLENLPGVEETLQGGDIGYGYGKGYAGLICVLSPHTKHVTLGIYDGARLADPQGLLEGSGKRHRHVKLHSLADVENPALLGLVQQALRLKGAPHGD